MTSDANPRPVSRRALLGSVAGLAAGGALPTVGARPSAGPSAPAPAPDPSLTVMTRNLYVGVDLGRLFRARSMADVRRITGEMIATVEDHPFAARAEAVAAEIQATRPDVVGLQEAATVRIQRPSDFDDDPGTNASDVVVDLLDLLSTELAARGLDYEVAAATVTTDMELPGDVDGRPVDVRLTDRTAVLVREGVETDDARAGRFDASLLYRMGDAAVAIERGYCLVAVTVDDRAVTVATAHLESTYAERRVSQARELLALLPTDRPVVLAGDLNSGPGGRSDAYDLLTESFDDAAASVRSGEAGATCCQPAGLRNDDPRLSRRVDAVLYRGGVHPTAVERVGAEPGDRVAATVDGETVALWPSDHAGVVATVETGSRSAAVPASVTAPEPSSTAATASATPATGSADAPAASATPATSGTSPATPANATADATTAAPTTSRSGRDAPADVSTPGFGLVGSAVALAAAALARRRRSD